MKADRCSLVEEIRRPLCGRPYGRICTWLLRMQCGATRETRALEPPVSVKCNGCDQCGQAAPMRKRPEFDF
jgi:hypothetical protein